MCYHFSLTADRMKLEILFGLTDPPAPANPPAPTGYRIVPSTLIPVLRVTNGKRELVNFKFGLIPSWTTGPKPKPFANARAETAPEKPAFRGPFRSRWCRDPVNILL